MASNILYYGDNLKILREHIKDESVDLIYLDPPFKSGKDYNVLFEEQNGSRSAAQIKVFKDTWRWDQGSEAAYDEVISRSDRAADAMLAFRKILGTNDMMAYLAMMAPRLVELRRVLKPTGSIYLHCDPTASHYLKMLMDAVFRPVNFCNEVIWHYRRWTAPSKRLQRLHDVILWYAKEYGRHCYNTIWVPPANVEKGRKESYARSESGKLVRMQSLRGERYQIERDPRGVHAGDVWHISFIHPSAKERLGYLTQKPEALLERIIKASSNAGDIILDPFCGCGTTIAIAQRLKRRWIGIDITHLAVSLIKHRLEAMFPGTIMVKGEVRPAVEYEVIGVPDSLPDARALAKDDPYQFQWWALGLVSARPVEQKKGSDKGIDGKLYFRDAGPKKVKQIIFSVKSGAVHASDIRDLRGTIEREKAEMGALLTLEEPTKPMIAEAATAGFYEPRGVGKFPKLQILTIGDLLKGKNLERPVATYTQEDVTFKKAPKAKGEKQRDGLLGFGSDAE